jgi:hypothetical protein
LNPDSKSGLETRFTPGVHLAAGVSVAVTVAEAVEIYMRKLMCTQNDEGKALTMVSVDVTVTYVVEGSMLKQEHALDSCDGTYVEVQASRLVLTPLFTTSGRVVVK